MKKTVSKPLSRLAFVSGMALAAWSPSSFACSDTPVLASICIMATPATFGNFNRQYVLAAGQQLQINQSTALYSLIGVTYGGDAVSNFKLPDLRGRMIIGADTSTSYSAGKTGGAAKITLNTAQLPPHYFQIVSQPVILNLSAITSLGALSGTASLANVTGSVTIPTPTMNVVSGSAGQPGPAGNYLGKANVATASAYSSATPDATLNANAISGGGTVNVTFASTATAPVTVTGGSPTTTITGSGTVTGVTSVVGSGAAIDVLPPYIALTYYIAATNGIYPSRD